RFSGPDWSSPPPPQPHSAGFHWGAFTLFTSASARSAGLNRVDPVKIRTRSVSGLLFRTVVVRDCTVDSGTRCGPCETGTFMNRPNGMTKCFSCTSCDPGLGLLTRQRCSATSDSVCGVLDGFFCRTRQSDLESAAVGFKRRASRFSAGTSRNDTVCEDCPGGSFSPDGVSCSPWTRKRLQRVPEPLNSLSV
uniref:TNFR-Cys domain-containing protein n=1 Tax=Nothobranchius furzeri TaxID=105023 RepID=A0A8C6L8T3_NOTFU